LGWEKHEFFVECDRAKRHEYIGKNGIENRLTVWILCAKRWKWKIGKYGLFGEHGRAPYRHGPCVWLDIELHDRTCCHDFGFCVFCVFSPFYVLNWLLV